MSEKLVRLWDKDWNLIASGPDIKEMLTSLHMTVDEGGNRKAYRLRSGKWEQMEPVLPPLLLWSANPFLEVRDV